MAGPDLPMFNSLPFYRRHTPFVSQPDYRIYELNKRLQQRSEVRLMGGGGGGGGMDWKGKGTQLHIRVKQTEVLEI